LTGIVLEVSEAVTLINVFTVPKDKEDEFVDWWKKVKAGITKQPGFISGKFHRSLRPTAGTTSSTSPCGRTKRSIGKPMKKVGDR
jgi:antibiotic biosynthesis monooxygenase (ABM) superfamily enzyme